MRILLSTIGSRGDVQPLIALALELRARGHDTPLVAPPNFREMIESFGLTIIPIGPDVRNWKPPVVPAPASGANVGATGLPKMSKEVLQQLAVGTVREQFRVLSEAARGCDAIVGATVLQIAAPSVAESLGIPYVFAAYAPVALPSAEHPPARMQAHYPMWLPGIANRVLWANDARSGDARFRATLNEERAKLGLAPVAHVQPYVVTREPLLAADPVLAPMRPHAMRGVRIVQTGAWLLADPTPLPKELEEFLAAGEPPVFFSFGSMRARPDAGPIMLQAARAAGRRAIVSRGWANLDAEQGDDWLAIGDVDHAKLLPRVAAIVHHGGAGTTTTAARAGAPQVIVPHNYDQFYWSHRMRRLGVGVSGPTSAALDANGMTAAVRACLATGMGIRARALANRVHADGTTVASSWLEAKLANRRG